MLPGIGAADETWAAPSFAVAGAGGSEFEAATGVAALTGGEGKGSDLAALAIVNLLVFADQNDPTLDPHAASAGLTGLRVCDIVADADATSVDRCFKRAVCGDAAADLASSTSVLLISTGVLDPDALVGSPSDVELELLRVVQRSRTPSTALKKFVDPTARVRLTASLAGASC